MFIRENEKIYAISEWENEESGAFTIKEYRNDSDFKNYLKQKIHGMRSEEVERFLNGIHVFCGKKILINPQNIVSSIDFDLTY